MRLCNGFPGSSMFLLWPWILNTVVIFCVGVALHFLADRWWECTWWGFGRVCWWPEIEKRVVGLSVCGQVGDAICLFLLFFFVLFNMGTILSVLLGKKSRSWCGFCHCVHGEGITERFFWSCFYLERGYRRESVQFVLGWELRVEPRIEENEFGETLCSLFAFFFFGLVCLFCNSFGPYLLVASNLVSLKAVEWILVIVQMFGVLAKYRFFQIWQVFWHSWHQLLMFL